MDMFRAMQSSSATILPESSSVGVVERGEGGGDGGGEGAETTAPSEFLTAEIWCKTITTLAQVRSLFSGKQCSKAALTTTFVCLCVLLGSVGTMC